MTKKSREQVHGPGSREEIKEDIKQSDKGGRPGQWSARKSQLLAGVRAAGWRLHRKG